jgi:hypothetical protein
MSGIGAIPLILLIQLVLVAICVLPFWFLISALIITRKRRLNLEWKRKSNSDKYSAFIVRYFVAVVLIVVIFNVASVLLSLLHF